MSKLEDGRELATEIKYNRNGIEYKESLTYIGSGSSCIAYKTESKNVIKEFHPLVDEAPVMERKDGRLVLKSDITDSDIINERQELFYSETAIVEELYSKYKDENDNMFLIPRKTVDTSLGECQWCEYLGGQTLEEIINDLRTQNISFKNRFYKKVLPLIISLYDEIAFYHSKGDNGILNLDIKPSNLFVINSQNSYIGVRNLDFGSAKRLDDKIENGKKKQGLINAIKSYALKNSGDKSLTKKIRERFFASSPGFYDRDRIKQIIDHCLQDGTSEADIISELKQLDILAAWKTFLYAMGDSCELFSNITSQYKIENESDAVCRIFAEIFQNNILSANGSLFESYNIYVKLYEIMVRSFRGQKRFKLSAAEIAEGLRAILYTFIDIDENKKTEKIKNFKANNLVFSQKDELLKSHNLKSIKDILEFNDANGLKNCEEAKSLHWFLLLGKKHK